MSSERRSSLCSPFWTVVKARSRSSWSGPTTPRGLVGVSCAGNKPKPYLQSLYDVQRTFSIHLGLRDDRLARWRSNIGQEEAVTMTPYKHKGNNLSVGTVNQNETRNAVAGDDHEGLGSSCSSANSCRAFFCSGDATHHPAHGAPLSGTHEQSLADPISYTVRSAALERLRQELMSMKTPLNVTRESQECGGRYGLSSQKMKLASSSPDILNDISIEKDGLFRTPSYVSTRSASYGDAGEKYSEEIYASDMNPSTKDSRRSLPSPNLRPQYRTPVSLGSEKVPRLQNMYNEDDCTQPEYDRSRDTWAPGRDYQGMRHCDVVMDKQKYPLSPVSKMNDVSGQTVGSRIKLFSNQMHKGEHGKFLLERDSAGNSVPSRENGNSNTTHTAQFSPKYNSTVNLPKYLNNSEAYNNFGTVSGLSDLNFSIATAGHNLELEAAGSAYRSPYGSGLPLSMSSPRRDTIFSSRGQNIPVHQSRAQSLLDLHKPDVVLQPSTTPPSSQVPEPRSVSQPKPLLCNDVYGYSLKQKDRSASFNSFSPPSTTPGAFDSPGSGTKRRSYIVKSTLFYNTSTQTESIPGAAGDSGSTKASPRMRLTTECTSQISPKTTDGKGRPMEEKSIQTALFAEESSFPDDVKRENLTGESRDQDSFFRYPSLGQTSAFLNTRTIPTDIGSNTGHYLSDGKHVKIALKNFSDKPPTFCGTSEQLESSGHGLTPEKGRSHESRSLDRFQEPSLRENASTGRGRMSGTQNQERLSSVCSTADSGRDKLSIISRLDASYTKKDMDSVEGNQSHNPDMRDDKLPFFLATHNRHRGFSTPDPTSDFSTNSSPHHSRESSGKVHDLSTTSGLGSDLSSFHSNPKSSFSGHVSSGGASFSSSVDWPLPSTGYASSSSSNTLDTTLQENEATHLSTEMSRSARPGSDSIFENDSKLPVKELGRDLSPRKVYRFLHEAGDKIFQPNTAATSRDSFYSSREDLSSRHSLSSGYSRISKYPESQDLGQIREEWSSAGDPLYTAVATAIAGTESSSSGNLAFRRQERLEKYPWLNQDWRRNNPEIPESNTLKRASSEQCLGYQLDSDFRQSTCDGEVFERFASTNVKTHPISPAFLSSANNIPGDLTPNSAYCYPRSKCGDPSCQNAKPGLEVYHRGRTENGTVLKPLTSSDLSASHAGNRSLSESISDIISLVGENIARSAQRVDDIRRLSMSSPRSSVDFADLARPERYRRETDWTRLRYSPDIDRWSNQSSFASENLSDDMSVFAPSTPRSSIAEGRDAILDTGDQDTSRDSGLVVSPTYQSLPSTRRAQPSPPLAVNSGTEPPPLPSRRKRENQQPPSMDKTVAVSLDNAAAVSVPGMFQQPLGRRNDVHPEKAHMDFQALMTRWENSTTGDDKCASDSRKRHLKLAAESPQQHQHHLSKEWSATPATYQRTRTNINYASTYKHEPAQRQEATSPVSPSSLLPSSLPSISSSSQTLSGTLKPSTLNFSPSSAQKPPGVNQSAFSSNHSPSGTVHHGRLSSPSAVLHSKRASFSAQSSAVYEDPAETSTIPLSSVLSPSEGDKTMPVELSRDRHGASSQLSSGTGVQNSTGQGHVTSHLKLRDRRASENDILSEKGPRPQTPQQNQDHVPTTPKTDPVRGSKGQFVRDSTGISSEKRIMQTLKASVRDAAVSPQSVYKAEGTPVNHLPANEDRFSDGSYIGHKSKSSRAIGSYKRSKSAAVLDSKRSNQTSGAENSPGQEAKLGQQSWNSESVLSQRSMTLTESSDAGKHQDKTQDDDRGGPAQGIVNGASSATPVRPPRPIAQLRHSLGHFPSYVFSTSSVSRSNNPSPSLPKDVQGSSVATKPSSTDQSCNFSNVERHSQVPVPYMKNPIQLVFPSQSRLVSESADTTWTQGNEHLNSGHQLQKKGVLSDSDFLASHGRKPATVPLQFSGHNPAVLPEPGGHLSVNEPATVPLPPRDYPRRESGPVRPSAPDVSMENKRGGVTEDKSRSSPRQSENSVSSRSGSLHSSADVSASAHARHLSQEELECDERARQLAEELRDKDRRLSEVLRLDANKKRMLYMDGLFSESATDSAFPEQRRGSVKDRTHQHSASSTNQFFSLPRSFQTRKYSPHSVQVEVKTSADTSVAVSEDTTLTKRKEELMVKLRKKLEVLKTEKASVEQEIAENKMLGEQVCQLIDSKCQTQSEKEKFKTYIDDLEKIIRLLLNLSGQLARAENAVQALEPMTDGKVQKQTIEKRDRLYERHQEARLLKENVERRSDQLSAVLHVRLSKEDFSDYMHFIKMKSKLTIELQEIDDKIALGEEQISELRKSLPPHSDSTAK